MSMQADATRARAAHHESSVSRPLYPPGTVRMRRWRGQGDVRGYRPPAGWIAAADLVDVHPVTHQPLSKSEWWIVETRRSA